MPLARLTPREGHFHFNRHNCGALLRAIDRIMAQRQCARRIAPGDMTCRSIPM
jgi:hypothetical protein